MGTLSSNYIDSVISTCIEAGADADQLYAEVPGGAKAIKNPSRRFHTKLVPDILNRVSTELNLPEIGLLTGTNFRPATFMHVGYGLSFARTLREALMINEKYQSLTQQLGTTYLDVEGSDARVVWTPNYHDIEYYKLATNAVFSGYANIGRWLLWQHEQPIKIMHFKHASPPDRVAPKYEAVFRSPVKFGAETDIMIFDAALADAPLPNSNPELVEHLCSRLDAALAEMEGQQTIEREALQCIQLQLAEGKPSLLETASRMGMSERTLRRKLNDTGMTYGALLEEARKQACEVYMRQNLGLSQIAQMLGYTDQSAFSRAFKAWFGMPPGQYKPNRA